MKTEHSRSGCRGRLRLLRHAAGWCWLLGLLLLLVLGRLLEPVPLWVLIPTTFLPYLFLPLLLTFAYALVRRRPRRHLPSLFGTVIFGLLFGRQLLPSLGGGSSDGLTVMSYNIQHETAGAAPLLAVIRPLHPAVLALQEVDQPRAKGDDLVSLLQEQLGYSCTYRAYYEEAPSAGIAVCVQPPILLHNIQRRTYHSRGRWSYLFAEMQLAGHNLNLVVPHLVAFRISDSDPVSSPRTTLRRLRWASRWHHSETNELLRLITSFRDPTIMAGDFNSTPNQAIHARIRRYLTDAFLARGFGLGATYRFGLPIRIDYIYVSRDIGVLDAMVGPGGASDHRPVIARIRLPQPSPSPGSASPTPSGAATRQDPKQP